LPHFGGRFMERADSTPIEVTSILNGACLDMLY
jgi:hypothetical protein